MRAGSGVANAATNQPPDKPTPITPLTNTTGVSLTARLEASPFHDGDGDAHVNSQWQADDKLNFTSPEWDSGQDYQASTEVNVPAGMLRAYTEYRWHVRYKDSPGTWSGWDA